MEEPSAGYLTDGGAQDVTCLVFKWRHLYKLVFLNCELSEGEKPVLFRICKNLHRVLQISELLDDPLPSDKLMMSWLEFYKFLHSTCTEERKQSIVERFKREERKVEQPPKTDSNSTIDPAIERMFRKAFLNNSYFELV
jgi:hypothetical protein